MGAGDTVVGFGEADVGDVLVLGSSAIVNGSVLETTADAGCLGCVCAI